jgi:hypothetical protein
MLMTHRSNFLLVLALGAAGLVGCGGSSPSAPVGTVTPTPIPTPTPTPTPSPSPTVPPGGADCQPGGDCSTNKNPVVRVTLRLYRLFDNRGQWFLPTPDPVKQVIREPIPVGFTLLLDITGRDKDNIETLGPSGDGSGIAWYLDPPDAVLEAGFPSPWQHKYTVVKPGPFTVYTTFDDVGSNDLKMTFVACVPGQNGCQP